MQSSKEQPSITTLSWEDLAGMTLDTSSPDPRLLETIPIGIISTFSTEQLTRRKLLLGSIAFGLASALTVSNVDAQTEEPVYEKSPLGTRNLTYTLFGSGGYNLNLNREVVRALITTVIPADSTIQIPDTKSDALANFRMETYLMRYKPPFTESPVPKLISEKATDQYLFKAGVGNSRLPDFIFLSRPFSALEIQEIDQIVYSWQNRKITQQDIYGVNNVLQKVDMAAWFPPIPQTTNPTTSSR